MLMLMLVCLCHARSSSASSWPPSLSPFARHFHVDPIFVADNRQALLIEMRGIIPRPRQIFSLPNETQRLNPNVNIDKIYQGYP